LSPITVSARVGEGPPPSLPVAVGFCFLTTDSLDLTTDVALLSVPAPVGLGGDECVEVLTLCALMVVRIDFVGADFPGDETRDPLLDELAVSAFATPAPPVRATPRAMETAPVPSHTYASG
jgi:hypothetical protein